jgi:hypothetical protein
MRTPAQARCRLEVENHQQDRCLRARTSGPRTGYNGPTISGAEMSGALITSETSFAEKGWRSVHRNDAAALRASVPTDKSTE